jgi:hypothetical protein
MKRLDFIKSLGTLAGVALAPKAKSEKLTLPNHTSNADMSIGVNGVERMRIYSDGSVGMANINPNYKLKI